MSGFNRGAWMLAVLFLVPSVSMAQPSPAQEAPAQEGNETTDPSQDQSKQPGQEPSTASGQSQADEETSPAAKPAQDQNEGLQDPNASDASIPESTPAQGTAGAEPTSTTETEPGIGPKSPAAQASTSTASTPAGVATSPPEAPSSAAGATGPAVTLETKAKDAKDDKPWSVEGTFEQTLGSGAFTFPDDSNARTVAYGMSLTLIGRYKVHELVSLYTRFDMDKQLTTTTTDPGTKKNEFYFRDIRLGATAEKLYKEEEYTGLEFGASTHVRFPTDKLSQAVERVLRWHTTGIMSRTFEGVGPGDLKITFNETLRKDFGPRADRRGDSTYVNGCRSISIDSSGECLTNVASVNWGLVHDLTVAYNFLEDWTVSVELIVINDFYYALNNSELPTRISATGDRPVNANTISRSRFANDGATQNDSTWGVVEVGYQVTENFGLALGLSSLQPAFIQSGDNSKSLRFPFWDFATSADNLSTLYFDVNFSY